MNQTLPSGIKTSEFIGTFVALITYLLVSTGVVAPERLSEVQEIILQSVTGVVALGSLIAYILQRGELKKKLMEVNSQKIG